MTKKQDVTKKQTRRYRAQWCRALRSGKFKQGQGALKIFLNEGNEKREEHCCLGVACEIFKKKKMFEFTAFQALNSGAGALPPAIRKALGLSEGDQSKLIEYNDTDAWTFKEIARAIESMEIV